MPPSPAFVDSDCLIHFTFSGRLDVLWKTFRDSIYIPDIVYTIHPPEISKQWQRDIIDPFIGTKFQIFEMDGKSKEYGLYLDLQDDCCGKMIGPGEAAALALAEVYGGAVISNNWRDVGTYAKSKNILHFTTARVLHKAFVDKVITIDEGSTIYDMLKRNGFKLPKARETFVDFVHSPI